MSDSLRPWNDGPGASPELVNFIDALGHQVALLETPSGLATILARSLETGLTECKPALDREMAKVLGYALLTFADGRDPL